jgi:hypothetical protein
MDMATAEYWIDAVALAGFFLLIHCGTYFVLRLNCTQRNEGKTNQWLILQCSAINFTVMASFHDCSEVLLLSTYLYA